MPDMISEAANHLLIQDALIDLYSRILRNPGIEEVNTCAKHLGMWHDQKAVFRNVVEETLLMFYRVYSYRPSGFNMAEKYLRLNRDSLDESDQFLLAKMSDGYFAIYRVEATHGAGIFTMSDVFDFAKFTLVDFQLAEMLQVGQTFASHIIDFGEFSIHSGPVLPLTREMALDNAVINALTPVYYDHQTSYRLNRDNNAKLARAVISAAVRLGFTKKFS